MLSFHSSSPVKQEISIAIQNFSDSPVKNAIISFFKKSNQWQQPWKIVEDLKQADFILICCNKPDDLTRWHGYNGRISRHQLISFSLNAFPEAGRWHLQQPLNGEHLSLIRFVMLLKEINQFWKTSQGKLPVPYSIDAVQKKFDHNWRDKAKILFVGSVGSGKTTAVSTLSYGKCINTEVSPTDEVKKRKRTTTVALDYGSTVLDDNIKVDVYGAPGQRRFDFMSNILIKQCIGIIILITNDVPDPFAELAYYLKYHKPFLQENKAVIGITHWDIASKPSLAEYTAFLEKHDQQWPLLKVDARQHSDVIRLVNTLFKNVIAQQ